MEQILELENTDDITAIRNRVDYILPHLVGGGGPEKEARRLLLVVPRQNKAMQSLVNVKLLARMVKSRAVELAIVSDHPAVRDYAKEADLKVFTTLTGARRAGWIKSTASIAPSNQTLPPPVPSAEQSTGRSGHLPPSHTDHARKGRDKRKYVVVTGSGQITIYQQVAALVLVMILAFALVFGLITLLPRATVTLTPLAQPVETELIVKADPNVKSVDFTTLEFPARVTQVELALPGSIETIETELAPVGYAQGTVALINRTETEQTIPISTTVSTSAGELIEFLTVQTATIPAGIGAVTSTQVIALEPGPQGNLSAGKANRFVDPTYALVARVINELPLSGGSMEPARIVVQADKERLQAHLRQLVYQQGLEQLRESLGEQEFISPETLQVIVLDVTYNEFSGDFSDTFSGEMQAVVRGTVVGGYNANRLAMAALEAQTPAGYELDIEGLQFGAGEVLDVRDGVVTFKIFAGGRAVPVIEPHDVAQKIAWLPIGEAQALLDQQYQLATVPGVDLRPDWAVNWLGRLPYTPLRIKVVVSEPVTFVAEGN